MNTKDYSQMTNEEKANYYFQEFKIDYDNTDCTDSFTKANCKENKWRLSKLKYIDVIGNEEIRDLYAILCDRYYNNDRD